MGKRAAAAAATRLQAAFRGYNVRRRTPLMHLRVIHSVRLKLKELQARAADPAYMDKLCADEMERRKLMEEAMAILLQLDGIQNVHPSVRGIRKSVNREVVQFMELIDAVVMGADLEVDVVGRTSLEAATTTSIGTAEFDYSSSSIPPGTSTSTLTSDNASVDNSLYDHRETQSSSSALDAGEPLEMMDYSEEIMPRAQRQREQRLSSSIERSKHYSESGSASGYYSRAGSFGPESNFDNKFFEADAIWVETPTPAEAALVVQSTFRGHRVRRTSPLKHLRVISEVRSKLKELSIQVSEPGLCSKLRSDRMERFKLSECITSLLLRLDSVQGVDEVVRDIRKSVTKEVFKLQDFVDNILSYPASENSIKESMQPLLTSDVVEEEIGHSIEDSIDATIPGATMGNSLQDQHGPATWVLENDAVEKLSLSDRDMESESQNFLEDHFDGSFHLMTSPSDQKTGKESDHSEPDRSAACDISFTEPDVDQMEMQNSAVSFASVQTGDDVHESAWSDRNPQAQVGEVTDVLKENRYPSYDSVKESEEMPESLMPDPRTSQFEDPSVLYVVSEDDAQPMVESSYVQQDSPDADISEQRISVGSAAEESSVYSYPSSPLMESLMNDFIALKEDFDVLQRINSNIGTVEASTCNNISIQQMQSNHQAELDFIAQKYNFGSDTLPDLVAGTEKLSTDNISIKIENDDLPSDMEVEGEGGDHTGISTPIDYLQDPLGVEMTALPSNKDRANQRVRHMVHIGDLIQENARLRTLLNEVLIFAEVQSAQTAAAMAKIDRLEVQVLLHKKSAEIWRKRSLLARRKK